MAYEEQDRALTFATGFVLGGLVGAGVALLAAPQSGRRTRRKLRHTAEDIGAQAEEKLEHLAEDAQWYADQARRVAERSGQRVRRSVERGAKEKTGG